MPRTEKSLRLTAWTERRDPMAANDADMPESHPLGDDLEKIAKDIAGLREDIKGLTGDVRMLGAHQVENVRALAESSLADLADAVYRDPFTAVGIAFGAGFLYGVLRG
jgi:hypothetical protein